MEAVVEPAVAPVPAAVVPVEAAHAEVAERVAVDRAPEEDRLALPLVGDEVRVLQVELEQVGVEDRLALELLAKLVADDQTASLLFLVEVQLNLARIELELTAPGVLHDLPVAGHEGIGVEIDDVLGDDHLAQAPKYGQDLGEHVTLGETLEVSVGGAGTPSSQLDLVGLADIEHQFVAHRRLLCCATLSW